MNSNDHVSKINPPQIVPRTLLGKIALMLHGYLYGAFTGQYIYVLGKVLPHVLPRSFGDHMASTCSSFLVVRLLLFVLVIFGYLFLLCRSREGADS